MCCDKPCLIEAWVNGVYVLQCLNCNKVTPK